MRTLCLDSVLIQDVMIDLELSYEHFGKPIMKLFFPDQVQEVGKQCFKDSLSDRGQISFTALAYIRTLSDCKCRGEGISKRFQHTCVNFKWADFLFFTHKKIILSVNIAILGIQHHSRPEYWRKKSIKLVAPFQWTASLNRIVHPWLILHCRHLILKRNRKRGRFSAESKPVHQRLKQT